MAEVLLTMLWGGNKKRRTWRGRRMGMMGTARKRRDGGIVEEDHEAQSMVTEARKVAIASDGGLEEREVSVGGVCHVVPLGARGGGGGGGGTQEVKKGGVLYGERMVEEEEVESYGSRQEEVENMGGLEEVENIAERVVAGGGRVEMVGGGGRGNLMRHHVDRDVRGGNTEHMVMRRAKIEMCAVGGGHVALESLDGVKLQEGYEDAAMDDNNNNGGGVEHGGGGAFGTAMVRFGKENNYDGEERRQSEEDEEAGTTLSPNVVKGRGRPSREAAVEWSEGATTVLLSAFAEKYRALERSNFTSKIWSDIAAYVNARRGPPGALKGTSSISQWEGTPKTQEQCRIKVDNLKKRYKVEREKMLTSGIATSKWPFYNTMEELIGSKPWHTRVGGGTGGSPRLGFANGQQLAIQSSAEEGDRIFYLEARNEIDVDYKSDTIYNFTPLLGCGKHKKAFEDLELEHINAASLRALFEGFNVAENIIDAMAYEEVDEDTLLNSKDVGSLLEKIQVKHQLPIKLGPAERIKQAIEEAKEKKLRAVQ